MYHRLMQLLHFLPDIPRYQPSLQYHFSVFHHLHLIYRNKADFSWRIRIAAPHIPHVLYESEYSIINVQISQIPSDFLDKIHDLISHKSTQGKLLLLTPCVLSVNDEITS